MSDRDLWQRYLERLQLLRPDLDRSTSEQRSAAEARARAVALADRAAADSEQFCADADRRIEQALLGARQVLLTVGEQGRVPPRMRPSVVPPAAGRDDVHDALGDLDEAVSALRVAVRAAQAVPPPPPPPAEPSAERPARPIGASRSAGKRPRRRPLLIGVGSAAAVVALAVAALAAFTTH